MSARTELRQALRRLDVRLAREVTRLRARYELSLDEFRGLYVSDAQVDALLAQQAPPGPAARLPPLRPGPRLARLVRDFGLSAPAAELLLLAMAPELDGKYATLLAYLNDDAQRSQPTLGLAWRLFGEIDAAMAPDGPLFGAGLLRWSAAERTPRALQAFAVHPLLAAHLLGEAMPAWPGLSELAPAAQGAPGPLASVAALLATGAPLPLSLLCGGPMSGRIEALQALAAQLGRRLLRLSLATAPAHALADAVLAARLADALLVIDPGPGGLAPVAEALREPSPVPIFLLAEAGTDWRGALRGAAVLAMDFAPPDATARRILWDEALGRAGVAASDDAVNAAADRFRLAPAQIAAAAASLGLQARLMRGGPMAASFEALARAARDQSCAALEGLATRAPARRGWSDLVLPGATLRQLGHFSGAIRQRQTVFQRWGFGRGGGEGLVALFSGGSGTGKSMAAEVLAHEAGLEIWRIDLSAVVSKYIGETEKQLERLFTLARDGDAILFFDEADALFGKRSEVKDAHDRYANIEVAYLLQRLEAYDGVAILATNLARNVDRAFSRRMHFVIEFPAPDAALRERLWRQALPAAAPLADDLDIGFLARRFAFAGGDIRVAVLDAAFAAAAENGPIDMARLLQAVARQLQKQGKVPQASDFRPYPPPLAFAEEAPAAPLAAQ